MEGSWTSMWEVRLEIWVVALEILCYKLLPKEVKKIGLKAYRIAIHQATMLRYSCSKKLWWCPWHLSFSLCECLWHIWTVIFERVYSLRDTYRPHRLNRSPLKALLLLPTQNFKDGFPRTTGVCISPSHVEEPFFLICCTLCQGAADTFFWLLVPFVLCRGLQRLPWACHSSAVGWSLLWYCQAPHCGSSRLVVLMFSPLMSLQLGWGEVFFMGL